MVSALIWYSQKEPYSIEAVMDAVWNEYNVQSTMIGGEDSEGKADPTIWVDVYDQEDIPKVKNYIENNLSKDDLEYYQIDVFLYESTP